jgi:hypothetical protein
MRYKDLEVDPRQLIEDLGCPDFTEVKWGETMMRFELDPELPLNLL